MSVLALYRPMSDGAIYASESNPEYTVRVRHERASKSISGIPATNQVTELISLDEHAVEVNGQQAIDKVSIRTRISCALENETRRREILIAHANELLRWAGVEQNVLKGFIPSSPPEDTTAIS